MSGVPWNPDEHSEKVKFLLAIGRASFDTPSEMTMALTKAIASTIIATAKADCVEADFVQIVNGVSTLLRGYVLGAIPIRDAHLRASHSEEN